VPYRQSGRPMNFKLGTWMEYDDLHHHDVRWPQTKMQRQGYNVKSSIWHVSAHNWTKKSQIAVAVVTTNKPTHNVLQAGCPSCCPTNIVKALQGKAMKGIRHHTTDVCLASSCGVGQTANRAKLLPLSPITPPLTNQLCKVSPEESASTNATTDMLETTEHSRAGGSWYR